MALQGLRHSGNFSADQRPKNFRETILMLYPNGTAPLTALTALMKDSSTNDPEFSWFEKQLPTQRMQLTADLTTGATTIAVTAEASQLKAGHVVRVEHTEELLYIVADPTNDLQFVCQRGFAGTTPATVTVASQNPFVHVIGSAYEEGSMAPTGVNYDPIKRFNYTQIFRNTLEMTRTASKTRLRTGDQVKEAKRECLELHSIEMEKAFIFGRRSEGTRNGKPFRTTGGVMQFINAGNVVTNSDGSFSLIELEGWLERMFRFGSSQKLAFCGNTALLAIQQVIRRNTQYELVSSDKMYGMNVSRLVCPFGELMLKPHKLFNQLAGTTYVTGVDSWLLVLDQANLTYRPLNGGDTQYEKNLTPQGLDGMKSGYLSECGIESNHDLSHFLIKGLRTAVADGS